MAKRTAARSTTKTQIIRAPAPVIRVSAPRAAPHKKKHHRRSGAGGGKSSIVANVVAGGLLGYLDKNATTFPTVPALGRAGTLAVVAYFWNGNVMGFSTRRLADGFAAIAAYEFTTKGSVSGW